MSKRPAREPDAPVPRRAWARHFAGAPTRCETRAQTVVEATPVDPVPTAPSGARDPDAPVPVIRTGAASMPSAPQAQAISGGWRARLADDVRLRLDALLRDHQLRGVSVAIRGELVELSGDVATDLERQIAEDLAYSLPTVSACDNHLRVAG